MNFHFRKDANALRQPRYTHKVSNHINLNSCGEDEVLAESRNRTHISKFSYPFKIRKLNALVKKSQATLPIDLHVHSTASKCGKQSMSQIISEAYQKNIHHLGVVDHLNEDNVLALSDRTSTSLKSNIPLLGIEVDFNSRTECGIPKEMLSKIDFTVGAIHWLQDLPVEFYPETKPENYSSGLKSEEVALEIRNQVKSFKTSEIIDSYVPTLHSLVASRKIEVWAHPFRLPAFCLIGNGNVLKKMEKQLPSIFETLKESGKAFELNEGLNNNLLYRASHFYPQVIRKASRFYKECLKFLSKFQIPIALGTDSHSSGSLGYYPWIHSLLKDEDLSKLLLLMRGERKDG